MRNKKSTPVSEVIKDFMSGDYSEELTDKVHTWLIDQAKSEEKEEALHDEWEILNASGMKQPEDSFEQVKKKAGIMPRYKRIWTRYIGRIAAVVLPLLLVAGVYYFINANEEDHFADVNVPFGATQYITLPDGSQVWMNAGTHLGYGINENSERVVELDGEAFFDVVKDEDRPFIVNTDKMSIKVLGTKFNVEAYSQDERYFVTLERGKIEVSTFDGDKYLLNPSDQFTYNKKAQESIMGIVETHDFSCWKEGGLVFRDMKLSEIFRVFERKYNMQFKIHPQILNHNDHYSVKFINDEKIEEVMDVIMQLTDKLGLTYHIQGNIVTVDKT